MVPKSLVRLVVFCYNAFNSSVGIESITAGSKVELSLENLFDYNNRSYQNLLLPNA